MSLMNFRTLLFFSIFNVMLLAFADNKLPINQRAQEELERIKKNGDYKEKEIALKYYYKKINPETFVKQIEDNKTEKEKKEREEKIERWFSTLKRSYESGDAEGFDKAYNELKQLGLTNEELEEKGLFHNEYMVDHEAYNVQGFHVQGLNSNESIYRGDFLRDRLWEKLILRDSCWGKEAREFKTKKNLYGEKVLDNGNFLYYTDGSYEKDNKLFPIIALDKYGCRKYGPQSGHIKKMIGVLQKHFGDLDKPMYCPYSSNGRFNISKTNRKKIHPLECSLRACNIDALEGLLENGVEYTASGTNLIEMSYSPRALVLLALNNPQAASKEQIISKIIRCDCTLEDLDKVSRRCEQEGIEKEHEAILTALNRNGYGGISNLKNLEYLLDHGYKINRIKAQDKKSLTNFLFKEKDYWGAAKLHLLIEKGGFVLDEKLLRRIIMAWKARELSYLKDKDIKIDMLLKDHKILWEILEKCDSSEVPKKLNWLLKKGYDPKQTSSDFVEAFLKQQVYDSRAFIQDKIDPAKDLINAGIMTDNEKAILGVQLEDKIKEWEDILGLLDSYENANITAKIKYCKELLAICKS